MLLWGLLVTRNLHHRSTGSVKQDVATLSTHLFLYSRRFGRGYLAASEGDGDGDDDDEERTNANRELTPDLSVKALADRLPVTVVCPH